MKLFATVSRYICLNCKQEFKTATRHNCKRDPDKKNCYTCKHNEGWHEEDVYVEYGDLGSGIDQTWFVTCAKGCDDISAPELSQMSYKLNCPYWELKEEE